MRRASRLAVGTLLAVLAALLGIATGSPATAATTPDQWGGALGDAGNSSTNLAEHELTTATAGRAAKAWTAAAAFYSSASDAPVVRAGIAYWTGGSRFLIATSVRTGATVWTKLLPEGKNYTSGAAISGSRLVLAYYGASKPGGGLLALDLGTRKILWQRPLPPERDGSAGSISGRPYIDAGRVYVTGSSNVINAYRLTTGKPVWRVPFRDHPSGSLVQVDGIAAGGGVVVTSGHAGVQTYRGSDGKRLWHSPAATAGLPVIAAGRVFVTDSNATTAQAFTLAGCRHSTCPPIWATSSYYPHTTGPVIMSTAGPSSVYATYTTSDNPPDACDNRRQARIDRLSATTGATEWTVTSGLFADRPVRGGDTTWVSTEYVSSTCEVLPRIQAFTATGASTTPLTTIDLTAREGSQDNLAVTGGTLLQQDRVDPLIGYRVPGT